MNIKQPKRLTLTTETLKTIHVTTNIKAGLKPQSNADGVCRTQFVGACTGGSGPNTI